MPPVTSTGKSAEQPWLTGLGEVNKSVIRKLPRWVWPAAGFMAMMAGAMNIVGLFSFEHQAVTHLTGTSSLLSHALAVEDWYHVLRLFGVVISFVLGACGGGLILPDGILELGRRHSTALLVEAALISLAAVMLNAGNPFGVYVISSAGGLQNAIGTAYSAAVVRTTHLTGAFTDIGLILGRMIRRGDADLKRLGLSAVVVTCFAAGGIAGTWLYLSLGYSTLFAVSGCLGLVAIGLVIRRLPIRP